MYGYRFLSQGFTDRHEILYEHLGLSQAGLLLLWGIAPGMSNFGHQQDAIWQEMLLAEALGVMSSSDAVSIKWFQIGSASLGNHGSVGMDQMSHGLGSSSTAMQNCTPASVVKQPPRPRMAPPSRVT